MQTRLLGIIGLAALTVAATTAAPAASRSETTTYVDGNIAGVSPNTGGTLVLSDEKAMSFRTGLSTVAIPWASVTHVELGATKETSHDVPVYKVWALHKRFGGKTETQLLIVNFKNEGGEEKSMTLEVAKGSAGNVLSTIQAHTANNPVSDPAEKTVVASAEPASDSAEPKVASNDTPRKLTKKEAQAEAQRDVKGETSGPWWGDNFWKTPRNSDKWNAKTPTPTGSNNNEQR